MGRHVSLLFCSFKKNFRQYYSFSISEDITPPEISGCPDKILVAFGDENTDVEVQVFFIPPTATDPSGIRRVTSNVGQDDRVSVRIGGATYAEYSFTDNADNVAWCVFPVFANGKLIFNIMRSSIKPSIGINFSPQIVISF